MSIQRVTWRDRSTIALATVGITAGLVAVNATNPKPAAAEPALKPFDSCANLASWYRAKITDDMVRMGVQDPAFVNNGRIYDAMATASSGQRAAIPATASAQDAVGSNEAGTNVQEAGVDEGDTAKVVESRLITVSGDRLRVVDVSGAKPVPLGSLSLPGEKIALGDLNAAQAEVLVDGDRVLVTWSGYAEPERVTTHLTLVDIADPATPRLISDQEVDGRVLTTRFTGGRARVVLSAAPTLPYQSVKPRYGGTAGSSAAWHKEAEAVAEENRQILKTADGQDFLPNIVTRDAAGKVISRTPLLTCDTVYHPKRNAGANTLSVATVDLTSADPVTDVTGLAADGDMVYASESRLYIATTRGGWFSNARPAYPTVRASGPARNDTEIHAFDITDANSARYTSSGTVNGWLLGRWAMSENNGLLRVATTRISEGTGTDAAVTVLREDAGSLTRVGSVGGMGKQEQIRAVRWFGDAAVVVTFRQTDPLYVLDLSDPTNPAVSGQLKVPGYSAYLHPVGDSRLIGVGQNADSAGRTQGTQVSTFDISDPASPTRRDVLTEKDTTSPVEFDSRAFSYLPTKRIALVPVNDRRGGSQLIAYTVGPRGKLTRSGEWDAKVSTPKIVVVDDDSVVAVTLTNSSTPSPPVRVTKLQVDGLTPTGQVDIP